MEGAYDWDESILSELSDSAFDFPALEFEDDYEDVESDEDVDNDVDLDEALIPALSKNKSSQIKPIDVLVDIDQNRKKVITLHNGSDGLEQEFLNVVARDVALKEYANSTVIFQIFSEKFNTWVDLDKSKELTDGTHLKAVFLAKSERTKESSHYKNKVKKRKRSYSSDNSKEERERRRKFRKRRSTSNEDDWKSEKSRRSRSSDESKRRVTPNLITSTATVCDNSNTCFRPSGNKHTENDGNFSQINDVGLCKLEFEANATLVNKSSSRNVDQQDLQPASEGELYRMSLGLTDKNPISALHELCVRLRWGTPKFEVHDQSLDSNDPRFVMKVTVRDQTYIPETPSRRKQLAKTAAAELCLKKLGVFQ